MLSSRISKLALIGLTTLALAGCATHHDRRASNTMVGAGVGAAAGAVVSQGNPWFTLGGAAAGGILGHVLTDDDRRRSRGWENNRRSQRHIHEREHRRPHQRHQRHQRHRR